MKIRNTFGLLFGIVGLGSAVLGSQVKETTDWLIYAKPYIWVFIICMLISVLLVHWNQVRRVTYPAVICIWAWLYEHRILNSEFSRDTYRVYKHLGKSYSRLFNSVQTAFDYYTTNISEV